MSEPNYGPADLYVVEFPGGVAAAEVAAAVRDVTAAGVITVLDFAVVRWRDGAREVVELDALPDGLGLLGVPVVADGLIGEDDLLELTEALAGDSVALAVLLENTWARAVAGAVQHSGAQVLSVERFPAEVVNEVATLAEAAGEES